MGRWSGYLFYFILLFSLAKCLVFVKDLLITLTSAVKRRRHLVALFLVYGYGFLYFWTSFFICCISSPSVIRQRVNAPSHQSSIVNSIISTFKSCKLRATNANHHRCIITGIILLLYCINFNALFMVFNCPTSTFIHVLQVQNIQCLPTLAFINIRISVIKLLGVNTKSCLWYITMTPNSHF